MNLRVLTMLLLVPGAPSLLAGQAAASAIDSAGISEAIAARLITRSASEGTRALAIDTTGNRWNGLVRFALLRRAPALVPVMSDSVAYYTTHFSVSVFASGPDSAYAGVVWTGCYLPHAAAFTRLSWRVIRERGAWAVHEDGPITTGSGSCTPYKAGGAR